MLAHRCRQSIVGLSVVALVLSLCAPATAHVILFKDGFVINGQIGQRSTFIVDHTARRAFSVPLDSTPYFLETPAKQILFTPQQVHDVLKDQPSPTPKWMYLSLYGFPRRTGLPAMWKYRSVGPWNERWEREVSLMGPPPRQFVNMKQRITHLTPDVMRVISLDYYWIVFYRTNEIETGTLRHLLKIHLDKQKKLSKLDKEIKIAKFIAQTGRTDVAYEDFQRLLQTVPSDKKSLVQQELDSLTKVKALEFIDNLRKDEEVGRHTAIQKKIKTFFDNKTDKLLPGKHTDHVYELKINYDEKNGDLREAARSLQQLTAKLANASRPFFAQATAQILGELNHDTLPRLTTFMQQARLYDLGMQQNRSDNRSPREVLAFALTGWLLGDAAAREDVNYAVQLWQARRFLLSYQREKNTIDRSNLLKLFEKQNKLGLDVVARVIELLPPPNPHQKLDTTIQELTVDLPGMPNGGKYFVKLPPEYHHNRSYPVLMVLHNAAEPATDILKRWSKLAARHGYILVAPEWATQFQTGYQWTPREHLVALNCLRDLRRRFQVDSDRVFLSGSEWGGSMAYDVGISHPDQFAGVLPMAAAPDAFISLYWSNAQYLPLYVVDGQRHGSSPKDNEKFFKSLIKWRYPALYVEYKGRGREWLGGEMPEMIDWMNRKKRYFPKTEIGSGIGQQSENTFRTIRELDNRFYWLSTKKIDPRLIHQPGGVWQPNRLTAKMRAKIHSQNQIYVYTSFINQVSIWIAPGMIDFARPVKIRVNRTDYQPITVRPSLGVMLEDFYEHGDRQRLFLARIDLNIRS